MKKELSWMRRVQKRAIETGAAWSDKASLALGDAKSGLKKLDDKHAITGELKKTGDTIAALAQQVDKRHDISGKAGVAVQAVAAATLQTKEATQRIAEESGLKRHLGTLGDAIRTHVADPAAQLVRQHELDRHLQSVGKLLEQSYGATRSIIKPYFSAANVDELLRNTRNELNHISACIMQISAGEAEKAAGQFGAAIVSKITGVATTGALLALVGTFGTAGTGTAIASLSGAAATNATLAWVGSLLGGGMAAGALLTGGLGIIAGLGAYKLLGSERRTFESLPDVEQRVVQSCWFLIAMIDDLLADETGRVDADVATGLLNNTLLPLQALLIEHADAICGNLDVKHALAFRQHVLVDYQRVVIDGFSQFIEPGSAAKSRSYEYVIGGVFYALLTRTAVDGSVESALVLDALRRSSASLDGASEAELSDYLDGYDADQLKGIANNIKGIYHEVLWVRQYNDKHEDNYAALFGATNHAGADIEIKSFGTDEVVDTIQLKATDSAAYVREHVERYPDIDVLVTNETAERMSGVHSSGIDNVEITGQVNHDLEAVAANTVDDRVLNSAELSAAISTGYELISMLNGKKDFPQAVSDTVKRIGTASAATAITAYLFS
ncbi:hypothetical protein O0882_09840 [Janthinobacterium sp. SUN073]|uniref:hypothetical protein n=1 Tax=Janthinobacterium sp. SUN073 TaxID=3004102 RepID=UPI0025AEF394|nr:hypothetical protein [Janthinobacterium sp. SUN073]MDN2696621.1 hypothetical protein [Janthinobacterium sp. SUN073]